MSERFHGHDPVEGDTAGVSWQGRTLRSSGFEEDDGAADARLAAALAQPTQESDLVAAVASARLVVPIVALPGAQASSDMAAVTLTSPDGQRALPAFTSVEGLRVWDETARPVPVSAQRAALAATQEGCSVLVLDPGSSWSVALRGSMVRALAIGRRWQPPDADEQVRQAVASACREEPSIAAWQTLPGEGGALVVELGLRPGLTEAELGEVVQRMGGRLAADVEARSRVDSVSFRLTTS